MNAQLAFQWQQWKNGLLAIGLFLAVLGPVVVLGGSKSIYVDHDNNGSEDGSREHPYQNISKALKHAKGSTTVYVAKGTYKENITLPSDVKLVGGKSNDDVVIKSDNDDKPTVTMRDDTELNNLTISGGRHGVRVEEHAEAKIVKVVIKNSQRDGVHIDKGSRDKKEQVLIDKSVIKGSRMAGIFSEKRRLIVTNTSITGNADGVDLVGGIKAWFADNRILDNRGSGFKLVIDGTDFWSKNNSIRRNGREGAEINSYGGAGDIGFKKATFIDNHRYGIARIVRGTTGNFSGLLLESNRSEGNTLGNLSAPMRIR
ncbi:MAG: right-handed parallel beta-helix repeat-containing protein [Undibacterium sp.]